MQECKLYKEASSGKANCLACAHKCKISEGSFGICGARKNINGKLFLLTYSKPCALYLDPIEKKPLFHYLPGTTTMSIGFYGCNFSCPFCQNFDISQVKGGPTEKALKENKAGEMTPEEFASYARRSGTESVAFTYNEPVISIEYALDAIKFAKKDSLGTVFVSNGYASKETIKALKGKLDANNIDLKSFSEDFYKKTCNAKLEHVLENIEAFHKNKTWIEITTLLIPKKNDSKTELKNLASFVAGVDKNIPWHVTAFHPMHEMHDANPTEAKHIQSAMKIGREAGLNYIYGGNLGDSDLENTLCPNCGFELIRRNYFDVDIRGLEMKDGRPVGKCKNCGQKIDGVF